MKKLITVLVLFFVISSAYAAVTADSLRIKQINGARYILHKVEKGEGLLAIARRYKVDVKTIEEHNKAEVNKLQKGAVLKVPVILQQVVRDSSVKKIDEAHANADAKEKEVPKRHVVQSGETLYRISQKYRITVQEITKWNNLKGSRLEPGQELIVNQALVLKPYESWNKPNSASALSTESASYPLDKTDLVEEQGFAMLTERGVLHREAPVGTLLLITDLDSGTQLFAKVTGKLTGTMHNNHIVSFDKATADILSPGSTITRIMLKYTSAP